MTCACVACVKWNSYRWQCIKIIKTTFQRWHTNWYQTQYGYCIWTEHLMTWTSIPIVRECLFARESQSKPQMPPIEIFGFIGWWNWERERESELEREEGREQEKESGDSRKAKEYGRTKRESTEKDNERERKVKAGRQNKKESRREWDEIRGKLGR